MFRKTYGEGASDSVWATSVEKLVLLDANMREEYLGIYEELNKNYKVSEDFEVGVSDINGRKQIFIGFYVAFDSVVNAICAIPFEGNGKQRDYDYLEICTFSELTVTGSGVRDKLADSRKLKDLGELPKVEIGTKVRSFLNGHEAYAIETTRSHGDREEVSLPMTVNKRFMGTISYNIMSIELI